MVSGGSSDLRRDGVDLSDRLFVVFNPASGRGRGARLQQKYVDLLRGAGLDCEVAETRAPGDERRLTLQALDQGFTSIVAVGGDGTWSHVADALLGSGSPGLRFGVLPAGTGNDFGRNLGLDHRRPDLCVEVLAQGRTRQIDVGRVRTPSRRAEPGQPAAGEPSVRHFLNVVGLGFDVGVIDAAAGARFLRGEALYQITALQQLFRFPGVTCTAESRSEPVAERSGRFLMVTVSNGAVFGGGFPIAPHAAIDDGCLHACFIGDASPFGRARLFTAAGKGRHGLLNGVFFEASTGFVLRTEDRTRFEVDGDVYEATGSSVEVDLLPGALEVFAP